ncbi:glycosyltransferase [Rheinheimera sp.]|uniref:glycosyltransferase family 2 protein n=1 Tax=Rheinheimera sp. TaxID=1869214 RepID=UPI00307EEB85
MHTQPLLSLVLPFYNAQDFLQPLLESIDPQLSPEVQLVLVADGPTDDSLLLAQQFIRLSQKGSCYMLLQQANAGVSVARNFGIAQSTGQYIGFVDADDLLLPGYTEQVLQLIRKEQPDLIELGYQRFSQPPQLSAAKARFLHTRAGWLPLPAALSEVAQVNQWFPWLRIYRRQAVPDFQFPAGIGFCEDMMAVPQLYLSCQSLYHLRQPLYGYRVHGASASYQVSPDQKLQLQQFFRQLDNGLMPQLPVRARQLMLLHLAYWLYNWQLQQPKADAETGRLAADIRQLACQLWWCPGFSWRKKWRLWRCMSVFQQQFPA